MKYIEINFKNAVPMTAKEAEEKGYVTVGRNVDDGYEITDNNGYKSWYPKDIFEHEKKMSYGLCRLKNMDWNDALNIMREQHVAVRRKNWSGEKYIFFVPEYDLPADTYIAFGYHPNGNKLVHFVDHILIHTKDNKFGFYATTQCDMMANDWEVFPKD